MTKSDSHSYSNKFYNVKIMRGYIAYLREKCFWTDEKIEQLLESCHCDITFLDLEDNWFDQSLADLFQENIQKMTGDNQIAYKVGSYAFSSYARGIFGRLIQGLATPQIIFQNIGKNSMAYSRGAVITAVSVSTTAAILKSVPVEGCDEKSYQCLNRKGMLEAVPAFFGCKETQIVENKCKHKGDAYCEYLIGWKNLSLLPSFITNLLSGSLGFSAALLITKNPILALETGASMALLSNYYFLRQTAKRLRELIGEKDNAIQESLRIFGRRYQEGVLKQNVILKTFQASSLDELCSNTAYTIKSVMKFDRVFIMLKDNERNILRTKAAVGFEGNLKEMIEMAEFAIDPNNNTGFFISVYNSGRPLFVRDVQKKMGKLSLRSQQLLKLLGTKAFIVVPIISAGKSVGVMAVENLDHFRPLINDDMNILMDVANLMGLVIPNVKNFIAIKKSEQLAKALQEQEQGLRKSFQKFVPGEAVSRLQHYGSEYLTVQKRILDVMFVDIVGFTSFSETSAPEDVAAILNIYIDEIQSEVDRYGGRINKIIGDGLLIYFDDMGPNSIRAGYAILQARESINRRLMAKGYAPISLGVGAHRGVCTIGYIGTKERLDYTLIGDTVNVAARIEGHTRKIGPNTFCFSSALIDAAKDFNYVSQGKVALKGRAKSVEVLQLLERLKNKRVGPSRLASNSESLEQPAREFAGAISLDFHAPSSTSESWNN
ncbi:MAG TPA: adenylate/guanylate cyclase domain-containing protein [bacterium]|nr:adenylate/guanylate cyclase domain-containing protein [bacterium]